VDLEQFAALEEIADGLHRLESQRLRFATVPSPGPIALKLDEIRQTFWGVAEGGVGFLE
jgi:hypothetical protein